MRPVRDSSQTTQRVKVGMIGLAAIVLLIGLASAIIGSVSREPPVGVAGSGQAGVVANMAVSNVVAADRTGEPLAEMGVAPSANAQAAVEP